MKYIMIESIVICALLTLIVVTQTKKNPLGGLHNLPIKIQKRVSSLPQYAHQNIKILHFKERVLKKLLALFIIFLLFLTMIYFDGAKTFYDGFVYTFVLWTIIKLYVVLILNCLWYAHSPQYWIKGTEDLKMSIRIIYFILEVFQEVL